MIHGDRDHGHEHHDPVPCQGARFVAIVGKREDTGAPLDPSGAIAAGCLVIGKGGHVDLGEPADNEPLDAKAWNLAEIACREANTVFALGVLSRELEALVDLADWQGAVIHRAADAAIDFSNPPGTSP
ncbi:MAG: hypothetical protein ACKO9Z_03990 [Planctomycetota bacterium]